MYSIKTHKYTRSFPTESFLLRYVVLAGFHSSFRYVDGDTRARITNNMSVFFLFIYINNNN